MNLAKTGQSLVEVQQIHNVDLPYHTSLGHLCILFHLGSFGDYISITILPKFLSQCQLQSERLSSNWWHMLVLLWILYIDDKPCSCYFIVGAISLYFIY